METARKSFSHSQMSRFYSLVRRSYRALSIPTNIIILAISAQYLCRPQPVEVEVGGYG